MAADEQPGLVEFLRARLDERAAKARAAMHGGEGRWQQEDPNMRPGLIVDERGEVVTYDEGSPTEEQTAHIEANDPAWVLAEVEAKRRIIGLHPAGSWATDEGKPFRRCGGEDWVEWPCLTLRLLALPYADHPAFKEEWRV